MTLSGVIGRVRPVVRQLVSRVLTPRCIIRWKLTKRLVRVYIDIQPVVIVGQCYRTTVKPI